MGGEKSVAHSFCRMYPGSPPHGRGKVCLGCGPALLTGITPAWAGKSSYLLPLSGMPWDHPRVGGEKGSVLPG